MVLHSDPDAPHALHDRLAKRILEQILDEWGGAIIEFAVSATDDQRFDLWYPGRPVTDPPCPVRLPRHLRLLAHLTLCACVFEIFSRAPQSEHFCDCLRKQLNHHHSRVRKARRGRKPRPPLFPLYVLCAGRPSSYITGRRLRQARGWPRGFYYSDEETQLWVVVLPELPHIRETLLLRLLGALRTRTQAERELARIPMDDPEREGLVRLAATLRLAVRRDKKIPAQQKEGFMTAAKRELEQMLKRSEEKGEEKGEKKGMAQLVLHVLKARGIRVTQSLRQRIVSCTDVRQLTAWAERAAVANSAAELFASS